MTPKRRNLAIGIGIQNFPEGLAVSMPLKAAGFSTARSIWYGQLSGLVEPVAGVLGALLVSVVVPILPYSLAFAAGAMVYVVVDDIIPEAQSRSVDLSRVGTDTKDLHLNWRSSGRQNLATMESNSW